MTPPVVVRALGAVLALGPVLQIATLLGVRLGAAAPDRPWSWVAYGLAAPYVATLLWRRHPGARFAAYVFLSHEFLRGLHGRHWDAVTVALAAVALLQLPAARRWAPRLTARACARASGLGRVLIRGTVGDLLTPGVARAP